MTIHKPQHVSYDQPNVTKKLFYQQAKLAVINTG